jgi:hypothetical protein
MLLGKRLQSSAVLSASLFMLTGLFMTCLFTGCGTSDRQRVYPVKGTITLEGKAMPGGGSIAFVPLEKQIGKTAGGEIREDGSYELTTYDVGDGSMAGKFRVVITQAVAIEPREAAPDGQAPVEGSMDAIMVAPEDHIAAPYSDFDRSPLTATVEPKSNEINFDLKRKLEPEEGSPPPGVASRRSVRTPGEPLVVRHEPPVSFSGTR